MTIQVQQHFNDIEMRVRALAITVLTAILGAAAVAIKNGTNLHVRGVSVSLGAAIFFIGLVIWSLFYLVDQIWYHRLLIGAVKHGEALEDILAAEIEGFGLTHAISKESPYPIKVPFVEFKKPKTIHSSTKLGIFYWCVAGLLVVATIVSAVSK